MAERYMAPLSGVDQRAAQAGCITPNIDIALRADPGTVDDRRSIGVIEYGAPALTRIA
jgi:hypothetical protein